VGFWDSNDGKFGRRFRRSDANLVQFYDKIYFDFGLTPSRHLKENTLVPVVVNTGFDNKPYGFEIRGNILSPQRFLTHGWGNIFHTISREIPVSKNRVWAFDITRLHEGILTGTTAFDSDAAYAHSDEYLKILRLIGGGMHKPLSKVPAITLDFGRTWERYAVPDRITFALDSMYPFTDSDFLRLIDLITHSYRNQSAPVTYSYSGNPATGTMEITVEEIVPEAPAPAPQPQQNAPEPVQTEEDGFPYAFYRGLGLIDEENMVWVPSSVGDWMRIPYPMTEPKARDYLLAYKPAN
jgi:hypothetical protein